MADEVFSLKNLFTTAVLALAIDLLFVFPVSHFSAWGQSVATTMGQFWGFIPDGAQVLSTGTLTMPGAALGAANATAATSAAAAPAAAVAAPLAAPILDLPY